MAAAVADLAEQPAGGRGDGDLDGAAVVGIGAALDEAAR